VCHVAPRGKGCYAAHSADTVPALWLYGASVEVVSAAGTRHIAIHDLYHDDGMRWLRIAPGELLTHVFVPHTAARVVHHKSRARAAIDYGWLLAAVERDAHRFRAVVSAVGPAPVEVTGESPEALAEAAYTAVQPLSTHLTPAPYRKRMVRVAVLRAARSLT
jgi:4-hydroxybenzoyl-CoA reductase subunit beta